MELISDIKCFGGKQLRYKHQSVVNQCEMVFSIFLPPQCDERLVPVIYWLSGLTCTDENFVTKAGAQRYAAEHGVAIVCPDTSPRGNNVPDDKEGAYDFGLGAGFYVNASQEPFNQHYQMYDYVVSELPKLIRQTFPVSGKASIMGHSMGGHGALTIALKNTEQYLSVSAFAPICSPMHCPWGEKALTNYLSSDIASWFEYDASELLKVANLYLPMLIDQGSDDSFLKEQLKPHYLLNVADAVHYPLKYREQPGYDHSYYFIASFIGEHIQFHASYLYGISDKSPVLI
ncbi:S-formylglutathione hydrolase [Thalassotalea sp. M1531]|uniref:S-formylglutathione hydrolase n=1 Tax=Thalassotalea algicola TaxID=2716224 RepID=A0A7Y0LDV4_9GAMM|nr:S-formylglutathione hydrolase [Thalassotalea algicola]NMP32337.1 S-formylglutathione hydrolase [Thalassotalea algicola]